MVKVFISSTKQDLEDYRQAAIDVCNELDFSPNAMEFFGAMGVGATEGSKREVGNSDLYVGIIGHRYGYIEPGYDRSVTEIEFDYAGECKIERICFIVDPRFPWPPDQIDDENKAALDSFKERITASLIRAEFTTVDNFKSQLTIALVKWKERHPEIFSPPVAQATAPPPKSSEEGNLVQEGDSSHAESLRVEVTVDDVVQQLLKLDDGLLSFRDWWELPELSVETVRFESDDNRKDFISLVNKLEDWQGVRGVRLKGKAGVGKTRLALEAIWASKLETTTIYVVAPHCLPGDFFTALSAVNVGDIPITLVIDNSTYEQTQAIWRRAKLCGERIQLICIETATVPTANTSCEFVLTELKSDQASRIVDSLYKKHDVITFNDDKRSYAAEFVGGNLRLLVAFVEGFLIHPEIKGVAELVQQEELNHLLTANLPEDAVAMRVLQAISLVGAVSVAEPSAFVGRTIAEFIGLQWAEFKHVAQYLLEKGLLTNYSERLWPPAGGHVRSLSSQLLSTRLATNVWLTLGDELTELLLNQDELRVPLLRSLSNLGSRKIAEPIVKRYLFEHDTVNDLVADPALFALFGEADPITTISYIERLLDPVTPEELADWQNYQPVVSMLTEALRLRETCLPAIRLLARFAAVEGESNNADSAKRVWRSIFFVRFGGNPATGEERHRIIDRLLHDPYAQTRILAVEAIRTTLTNLEGDFIRHGIGGYLSSPSWFPETWAEFWDIRRRILVLLGRAIADNDRNVANLALEVLFSTAQQQMPVLFDEVISHLEAQAADHQLRVANVLKGVLNQPSARLTQEQIAHVSTLIGTVITDSYHDRLLVYVVDGNSGAEDRFANPKAFEVETETQVWWLVKEALQSPELLETELEWLISKSVDYPSWINQFMFKLGQFDVKRAWFEKLQVASQNNKNWVVLEHYLRGRIQSDDMDWVQQRVLELGQGSQELAPAILEIILITDPTQQGVSLVLSFLAKGWINAEHIAWRRYWAKQLSADSLYAVLEEINKNPSEKSNFASIMLLGAHLEATPSSAPVFADLAIELLKDFKGSPQRDFTEWRYWRILAVTYCADLPLQVADAILTVFARVHIYFHEEEEEWKLLGVVVKASPRLVWERITERMLADSNSPNYIGRWDAPNFRWINFTDIVGVDELVGWAGNSPERAELLAEMIDLRGESLNPVARELLIRFPDDEDVRVALNRNHVYPVNEPRVFTYFDRGELETRQIEKYRELRIRVTGWRTSEHQPEVIRWIDRLVDVLDKDYYRTQL
ncbi:MAG: DUF4062 domain-containing protein [Anaerolineae bacterium]|nr:DUF4062 domain-containing protein [Anaerolineae bacterium]